MMESYNSNFFLEILFSIDFGFHTLVMNLIVGDVLQLTSNSSVRLQWLFILQFVRRYGRRVLSKVSSFTCPNVKQF